MKSNENVSAYGRRSVETVYKALENNGFTHENCSKIITTHPQVLSLRKEQIEYRLQIWNMAKFSRTQYYDLFVQCPEILDFDDEKMITKRYTQLQSIVATPKNVWRILMSSPNVLVDDIRSTEAKVNYVVEEMMADVTDLVKSGVLGLPLDKIKTRHMLLVRLGLYKKRNLKASELNTNKNPRLFRIMDACDEEFAIKTCGISMKELNAFNELYERELEEKRQEELDYDEDTDNEESDSDDDENYDPRETGDYYDDRHGRAYKKHLKRNQKKKF